jgi:hypothetical protein
VSGTADGISPLPEKEITMKKPSKPGLKAHLNGNEAVDAVVPAPTGELAAIPKKKTVVAKVKALASAKAGKSRRRPLRAASDSNPKKLVCRYCGSDDLAPSFIKRRDARCRACFKQRYGPAARDKNATQPREAAEVK